MQQAILDKIWEILKPLLLWLFELCKIAWQWIVIISGKIYVDCVIVYNFTLEIISAGKEKYEIAKPIAIDFAQKNRVAAAVIVVVILLAIFFWICMLRHAAKNEESWRKTWIFFIFIFGPLGALVYYFGRKRALEKKEYEQQRVALSFFSPMSKGPTKK
jgi:positive regulator of sigma E activity